MKSESKETYLATLRLLILPVLMLGAIPAQVHAAWTPFLTIRQVLAYTTGNAQWVQLDLATPTNPNNCQNGNNWFVLMDSSTTAGKVVLSTLQTAWVAGKPVRINTSTCPQTQNYYPAIDTVSTSAN